MDCPALGASGPTESHRPCLSSTHRDLIEGLDTASACLYHGAFPLVVFSTLSLPPQDSRDRVLCGIPWRTAWASRYSWGGGGAQPTNISRLAHQAAGGVLGRAYPCPHGMGLFQQPSEPSWGRDRVATSSAREHRTSV